MRRRLLILILVFLPFFTVAQQTVSRPEERISILKEKIRAIPQGREYVNAVLELVREMHLVNYSRDSSDKWLLKAEHVADQLEYREGLRQVYLLRGNGYEILSRDYQRSLYWYEAALKLAVTDAQHHELFTSILNLNFYLGDFVNAMTIAARALKMAEAASDEKLVAHYYNVIGFVHLRQNNANAALGSYQQYLQLAEKMKDSAMTADAYSNLAEAYLLEKDFKAALDYLFMAKSLYENLNRRGRLIKKDRLPYISFKIGYTYGQQGDLKMALHHVEKALRLTKTYSCNLYDVASYYIYAGNLYTKVNDGSRSFSMLREGLSLAREIDHKENIRDAYLYLHRLFAKDRDYDSAYYYYSLYDGLKDSISNEKTRREIRQIEASYKVEKKDREIELLLQQQALADAKSKRKLMLRNLVIIFFVLVTVIIAFLLNRRELRRKNEAQKEINERQNEIFNIIASTQDQERKRIAQDLHDGMGTLLSAAKLKLSSVPGTQEGAVQDTIRILDDAVTELRNISHNIMPATLSRIGLVGALQNFFGRMKNPGISFDLIHNGFEGRIEEEKEIILYRCILELVNNAVRHSGGDTVTIQLVKHPGNVNVMVEDNGTGMSESDNHEGIGLKSIASRIRYLEGNFTIDSGPNGTTAIIDIPV